MRSLQMFHSWPYSSLPSSRQTKYRIRQRKNRKRWSREACMWFTFFGHLSSPHRQTHQQQRVMTVMSQQPFPAVVRHSYWCSPSMYIVYPFAECILGNPNDPPSQRVCLPEKSIAHLKARESICKTPQKLALSLLSWLFIKQQLLNGICTPQAEGSHASKRTLLDQSLIEGIRCKYKYMLLQIYYYYYYTTKYSILLNIYHFITALFYI